MALCERYVNEAVSAADLREVRRVALDEPPLPSSRPDNGALGQPGPA
jgi:hypothetical protein